MAKAEIICNLIDGVFELIDRVVSFPVPFALIIYNDK